MKLDAESLVVESFDVVPSYGVEQAGEPGGGGSRYCTLEHTCATCWTDCPCA